MSHLTPPRPTTHRSRGPGLLGAAALAALLAAGALPVGASAQECTTCWTSACPELKSYVKACSAAAAAAPKPTTAAKPPPQATACRDAVGCLTACNRGEGEACFTLGSMYESGVGVEQNEAKALKFYKAGCDAGAKGACKAAKPILERQEALQREGAAQAEAARRAEAERAEAARQRTIMADQCRKTCEQTASECGWAAIDRSRACDVGAKQRCEPDEVTAAQCERFRRACVDEMNAADRRCQATKGACLQRCSG
jgi:TPR repeat protein